MRIITSILFVLLLALAACASEPLYPAEGDDGDFTPVDLEDKNTDDDTNEETEQEVGEMPEESDDTADTARDEYDAVIEAVAGDLIELDTRATDPDGDEVVLTFGEPFNEDGTWQTQEDDAGEYEVDVLASDGQAETTARLLVILRAANSAPEISGPDVITVEEGELVDLGVFTIVDPDGDDIITSYAGWMSSSTYETDYNDAGEYEVRIIAEDSEGNEAVQALTVVVENVNREPSLEITDRRFTVVAGELARIEATATDEDGDEIEITFEEPFDENGEWQTEEGDEGEYRIEVVANDGNDEVSRTVFVTVDPANRPPVIEVDATITVAEGDTIDLSVLATVEDPEGEEVDVSYSGWMDEAVYTTSYDDAGEYEVTITATDGEQESSIDVTIVVEDTNRPPVFIRPA